MVKLSAVGFDCQLSTQLVRYDWFTIGGNFLNFNKITKKQKLKDLAREQTDATCLFINNQSAIRLLKNPEFHK